MLYYIEYKTGSQGAARRFESDDEAYNWAQRWNETFRDTGNMVVCLYRENPDSADGTPFHMVYDRSA